MHMGMIAFVVIGGVPAQVGQRDFHILRNGFRLGAEKISPCVGVVVTKPGGVLPAQRNNVRPHIAVVVCHFLRYFGEVNRNIRICKQSVRALPLGAGTLCNIRNIIFPLANQIYIVIDGAGDKFRGCPFARMGKKIRIFKAVFCIGEIPDEFVDQLFLFLRCAQMLPCVIDFLNAVTLGDIVNEMLRVQLTAGLQIAAFQNDSRHAHSPF